MSLQRATKTKLKLKIVLQGVSGSGKTYSALDLAYGIVGDWEKIVVIDTENESSNYYADKGDYFVYNLKAPYTPERYQQAVTECIKQGMQCIIIDSLSHEWNGSGGALEMVDAITAASNSKNSFNSGWGKVSPKHNAFMQFLVDANVHIIGTLRTKNEYVLQDVKGRQVPQKVGLKPIAREDTEYEFGIVFEIDRSHHATCSKDRTRLFEGTEPFIITSEAGQKLVEWANTGVDAPAKVATPAIQAPAQPEPLTPEQVAEKVNALVTAFEAKGIDKLQIKVTTGKDINEIEEADIAILREMYKELVANPAPDKFELMAKYKTIFQDAN